MRNHRRASSDRSTPPTALQLIDQQCGEHLGEWLLRIRIHTADYAKLRDEVKAIGLPLSLQSAIIGAATQLSGAPFVFDDTCVEGPVCDWAPMPDVHAAAARVRAMVWPDR